MLSMAIHMSSKLPPATPRLRDPNLTTRMMYGGESRSQYGSGERPQAYVTGVADLGSVGGNQTRQLPHGYHSEHPYTTNHASTGVRLPPFSSFNYEPPTRGPSAMHTDSRYNIQSQSRHVSDRWPQAPTMEVANPDSMYSNQNRYSTQDHQSECPYTNQTSGQLRPLSSFSNTLPQPAREPGRFNMDANPDYHMQHEHQNHNLEYVQQPQYAPWSPKPPDLTLHLPQAPENYQVPRVGFGAGYSVRKRARR